ncbi:DNA polymerase III subunit chi [Halomonas sp. S2151]|jgi:DNA polymerase-3 subunit chi|uniref:DNA polymerase III subunit chi n=1 Tax=unclassified Halomonas TaxID=2609666 RepID=UPI0005FA16E1|nr:MULTISPECIES: DNA polymerase III subunit chi [unclassified Halomonas]KJZ06111.1 DNA polymerase III subunit chi [Halomonas sp. S2151]MAR72526.1 DNA polymerase III subunit chi [Halomonas sp.]MBR9878016.1 DNA polymerase III subunit chi [Gammaproteobacteria bacterium]|tara:strand:- start:3092 stop:3589 length:498 start_codon:yes stop_codon:yes gene_type:complete
MTKIDFYILPDTTLEARLAFACRLTETIARKGYRLYLYAEDEAMARELDQRLWDFRPDAFVPHALEAGGGADAREAGAGTTEAGIENARQVPVTIGWQGPPQSLDPPPQAMLNLSPEIPEWFSRFERVAEIINQHQDVLTVKRECWKTYKQRGYPVTPHHLKGQG